MKNEELRQLHEQQLRDFDLARANYAGLKNVVYRNIPFGEFSVRLQYNPARMISTNASIDPATLASRKCFLCPGHMPAGQNGIPYGNRYHIFINPYPIFNEHFTVPDNNHLPQLIETRFEDLLNLAFDFPDYTSFYNGPASGASAPDHFHFQMVPRNAMPLETDICNDRIRRIIARKDFYTLSVLEGYLREVIVIQASDLRLLSELFFNIRQMIGEIVPFEAEPMLNLIAWFDNCQWTVCILPRQLLRPWQFFAEGNDQVLFSPGCVDMAGLIITPRREDFDKYSAALLTDLFRQVTPAGDYRASMIHHLQNIRL